MGEQKCSIKPRILTEEERWELGPLSTAEILGLPAAVDFVDAARAFALRRTAAHELSRRGQFPVPLLKLGRVRKARRADILEKLGIEDTAASGGTAA